MYQAEAILGLLEVLELEEGLKIPNPSLGSLLMLDLVDSPFLKPSEYDKIKIYDLALALACITRPQEVLKCILRLKYLEDHEADVSIRASASTELAELVYEVSQKLKVKDYEKVVIRLLEYLNQAITPLQMIPQQKSESDSKDQELKKN